MFRAGADHRAPGRNGEAFPWDAAARAVD